MAKKKSNKKREGAVSMEISTITNLLQGFSLFHRIIIIGIEKHKLCPAGGNPSLNPKNPDANVAQLLALKDFL
ncbi:hypothetical protein MRB53_019281 [Persea americana]|uniref:Uncharacterized protein n=1 Tax=Persea americana TaxID=3435 RepID=A0ACC2KXN8_PERAE|nr:hypothetical protein MRB53_019281 [Persea americana]